MWKHCKLLSGKTQFLDDAGKVVRSDSGKVVVTRSKTHITIMHNDDDNETLEGTIADNTCDWMIPFKKGKTSFDTRLIEKSGQSNAAVVTIEGKDGQLVITVNFKERGMTVMLIPECYQFD